MWNSLPNPKILSPSLKSTSHREQKSQLGLMKLIQNNLKYDEVMLLRMTDHTQSCFLFSSFYTL